MDACQTRDLMPRKEREAFTRHAQILRRQKQAAQDDSFVWTGETPVLYISRTGMSALHFYEQPLVLPQLPHL